MDFKERKRQRTEYFEKHVKGVKMATCSACGGTGIYDYFGSPPCGACGGTGKEQFNPSREKEI